MNLAIVNKRYFYLKLTFFVPAVLMVAFYVLAFVLAEGRDDPLWTLAVYMYMAAMGVGLTFYVALGMLARSLGKNGLQWSLMSFLFPLIGGVVAFVMIRARVKKARMLFGLLK